VRWLVALFAFALATTVYQGAADALETMMQSEAEDAADGVRSDLQYSIDAQSQRIDELERRDLYR
jgi:hypothetical protein